MKVKFHFTKISLKEEFQNIADKLGLKDEVQLTNGSYPIFLKIPSNGKGLDTLFLEAGMSDVSTDCSVFCQIQFQIHRLPELPSHYLLAIGYGWRHLFLNHFPSFASHGLYLRWRDEKLFYLMTNTSNQNKGEWLLQVGDNQFKGLQTEKGEMTQTLEEWKKYMRQGTEKWMNNVFEPDQYEKEAIELYFLLKNEEKDDIALTPLVNLQ